MAFPQMPLGGGYDFDPQFARIAIVRQVAPHLIYRQAGVSHRQKKAG
jgi:hypothetical protein